MKLYSCKNKILNSSGCGIVFANTSAAPILIPLLESAKYSLQTIFDSLYN